MLRRQMACWKTITVGIEFMSLKQRSVLTVRNTSLGLPVLALVVAIVLHSPAAPAQTAAARDEAAAYQADPVPLVRDASYNEMHSFGSPHRFRYRLSKTDEKGSSVKEIIETPDGDVARLMRKNGQPLSPEAEQAEMDRLNNLLAHPEIQEHRHKKEQEDSDRADTMVKMLPDAFTYKYLGVEEGLTGPAYRLSFTPNPKWSPPNREAEVFHGMAGELWIDVHQKRMARFSAHLISDVDFGWGFVGRLYKGGTILVEQKDVGNGHWETVTMKLNLNGKILMMKSLVEQTQEDGSEFVPLPPGTDLRAAIGILKDLPADK
jgi:hypothetical protein